MNFLNSNLFLLFDSLSATEIKEVEKALVSPFFNQREEERRLFKFLLKIRKSSPSEVSIEDAFEYVFPDQKKDLAKIRHVMTYLLRIINRYIAIREMENSESTRSLLLIRSLRRRKLDKLFLSHYEAVGQYYEQEAPLSPDLYYNKLQVNTEYYGYSITNRRAKNEDLKRLSADLDTFYLIQKLKQACNILSYKNIFKYEETDALTANILPMMEKKNLQQDPLVRLFYLNYRCLSEPDREDYFVLLKEAILNESARVEMKELKDIFTLAINYCIRQLNTGAQKYYQEVFDLYRAGLDRGVFEEGNVLSAFTYKNISAIAIGLRLYDWAAQFIDDYKAKLEPDIREGFYAYCKARYYFACGEFEQVGPLLQQVDIREQFTDLDARVLLIKTYYELDQYDLLSYSLDNLKQQLKRKNTGSYHQAVYGHFARMVSRLIHLRVYDQKARAVLSQKIESIKAVAEKEWLLAKVKNKA